MPSFTCVDNAAYYWRYKLRTPNSYTLGTFSVIMHTSTALISIY
jgi:hypothetical protein